MRKILLTLALLLSVAYGQYYQYPQGEAPLGNKVAACESFDGDQVTAAFSLVPNSTDPWGGVATKGLVVMEGSEWQAVVFVPEPIGMEVKGIVPVPSLKQYHILSSTGEDDTNSSNIFITVLSSKGELIKTNRIYPGIFGRFYHANADAIATTTLCDYGEVVAIVGESGNDPNVPDGDNWYYLIYKPETLELIEGRHISLSQFGINQSPGDNVTVNALAGVKEGFVVGGTCYAFGVPFPYTAKFGVGGVDWGWSHLSATNPYSLTAPWMDWTVHSIVPTDTSFLIVGELNNYNGGTYGFIHEHRLVDGQRINWRGFLYENVRDSSVTILYDAVIKDSTVYAVGATIPNLPNAASRGALLLEVEWPSGFVLSANTYSGNKRARFTAINTVSNSNRLALSGMYQANPGWLISTYDDGCSGPANVLSDFDSWGSTFAFFNDDTLLTMQPFDLTAQLPISLVSQTCNQFYTPSQSNDEDVSLFRRPRQVIPKEAPDNITLLSMEVKIVYRGDYRAVHLSLPKGVYYLVETGQKIVK